MAKSKNAPLILPVGRLSYPALYEPAELDNKYSATIIWPPEADLSELEAAIQQAVAEKWGKNVPKNVRLPLKDCADKTNSAGDPVPGYEGGGRYLKAWTRQRPPRVVGREKDPSTGKLIVLPEHEVYGGCYVRVSVSIFANHNEKFATNDVIAGLVNVQKWDDGEPFGGVMSAPEDDFLADDDLAAALE